MEPPKLSDTQMAEKVADVMTKRGEANGHSRIIEDVGFGVGILMAVFVGSLEALKHYGIIGGANGAGGLPWFNVILFAGCVLPKMLGRATAGRIWDALTPRLGK